MNLTQFQRWAKTTAIYPDANTGSGAEAMYLALGLVGEIGELITADHHALENDLQIKQELGDIYWYVVRLAESIGWNFSEPMEMSVETSGNKLVDWSAKLANKVKKLYRDGNSEVLRSEIKEILSDMLDMLDDWCDTYNFVLKDVLLENCQKLESRKTKGTLTGSGDNR